ncbi:Early activation antigen CD69, partial [Ophiophagus hannah]
MDFVTMLTRNHVFWIGLKREPDHSWKWLDRANATLKSARPSHQLAVRTQLPSRALSVDHLGVDTEHWWASEQYRVLKCTSVLATGAAEVVTKEFLKRLIDGKRTSE